MELTTHFVSLFEPVGYCWLSLRTISEQAQLDESDCILLYGLLHSRTSVKKRGEK